MKLLSKSLGFSVLLVLFLVVLGLNYSFASHNLPPFGGDNSGAGFSCLNSTGGATDCYFNIKLTSPADEYYQAYWRRIRLGATFTEPFPDSSIKIESCLTQSPGWPFGGIPDGGSGQVADCTLVYQSPSFSAGNVPVNVDWGQSLDLSNYTSELNYAMFHVRIDDGSSFSALDVRGRRVGIGSFTTNKTQYTVGETITVSWSTTNAVNQAEIFSDGAVNAENRLVLVNGSASFVAQRAGTAFFTLKATGPGNTSPSLLPPAVIEESITANVVSISSPLPSCSPLTQSVQTGQTANFSAAGGDNTYSWSATGGSPSSGTGSSFSTSYSSTGTKTVSVTSASQTANCSVTVTSGSVTTHILTVTKTGSGTVAGPGIDCGGDCSESYSEGASVILTASPSSGSVFTSWSGCNSTSGNNCTVTMTSAKTVTATFTADTGGCLNCAQFISQTINGVSNPSSIGLQTGQTYPVTVVMKNTGTATWTCCGSGSINTSTGYKLGSQNLQDNFTWGLARVGVPTTVSPGQQATFNFSITAPSISNTYNFRWRTIYGESTSNGGSNSSAEWFGDFTPNVVVNVSTAPPVGTISIASKEINTSNPINTNWTLLYNNLVVNQETNISSKTYTNKPVGQYDLQALLEGTTHVFDHFEINGVNCSISTCSQTLNTGGTLNYIIWYRKKTTEPLTGTIQVSSNRSTSWTISGPASYSGSGTSATYTNAPTGAYTISPANLSGYTYTVTPSPTQTLNASSTITFNVSYSPVTGFGLIQGYKVPNTNSTISSQTVRLDGGSPTTNNPYGFTNVSAGNHTVSVTVLSGWSVGYTLCYNSNTCHGNTPTLGSSVTVNVPASGYADLYWHYTAATCQDTNATNFGGPLPCTYPPGTVTASCTVNVESPKYNLNVSHTGSGSGTVTGSGINCGSDCFETYNSGSCIEYFHSENPGSTWGGWSGACTGPGCVICFDSNKSLTAMFNTTPKYTLTVNKTGSGSGTVTGLGINCGSDCSETYDSGTTVEFFHSESPGSTWGGWSGACTGPGCIIVVSSNTSLTAMFNSGPNPPGSVSVTEPNYCVSGPAATINWNYSDPSGSPQSAYQVQVDDQGSFSSPEVDSGKTNSGSTSYFTGPGKLAFNTTYKARVRVWNSFNVASGWTESGNWKTPLYAYPQVNFTWTPLNPPINAPVQFTDQTVFNGNPNGRKWSWTFGDSGSSTQQNPTHSYAIEGTYYTTLAATDNANQTCSRTKGPIQVQKPIPIWKEIAPR